MKVKMIKSSNSKNRRTLVKSSTNSSSSDLLSLSDSIQKEAVLLVGENQKAKQLAKAGSSSTNVNNYAERSSKSTKDQSRRIKKIVGFSKANQISAKIAISFEDDEEPVPKKTVGYTKHHSRKFPTRATLNDNDSLPHKRVTRSMSSKSTKEGPQTIKKIMDPISKIVTNRKSTKILSSLEDDKETVHKKNIVGYTKYLSRKSTTLDDILLHKHVTRATSYKSTNEEPPTIKKITDTISKAVTSQKSAKVLSSFKDDEGRFREKSVRFRKSATRATLDDSLPQKRVTRSMASKFTKEGLQVIPKTLGPTSKAVPSQKSVKPVSSYEDDEETSRKKTVGYTKHHSCKSATTTRTTLDDCLPQKRVTRAKLAKSTNEQAQAIQKSVSSISKAVPHHKSAKTVSSFEDDEESFPKKPVVGYTKHHSHRKSATHATLEDSPSHTPVVTRSTLSKFTNEQPQAINITHSRSKSATSPKSTMHKPQAIQRISHPTSKTVPSPKTYFSAVDSNDDSSEDPLSEDFLGFIKPCSQRTNSKSTKLQPQAIQRLKEHIEKATLTPIRQATTGTKQHNDLFLRKRRINSTFMGGTTAGLSICHKRPCDIYSNFLESVRHSPLSQVRCQNQTATTNSTKKEQNASFNKI